MFGSRLTLTLLLLLPAVPELFSFVPPFLQALLQLAIASLEGLHGFFHLALRRSGIGHDPLDVSLHRSRQGGLTTNANVNAVRDNGSREVSAFSHHHETAIGCPEWGAVVGRQQQQLTALEEQGGTIDHRRGFLVAMDLGKVLLGVRSNLGRAPGGNPQGNLLPFPSAFREPFEEGLVLVLGPSAGRLPLGPLRGRRSSGAIGTASFSLVVGSIGLRIVWDSVGVGLLLFLDGNGRRRCETSAAWRRNEILGSLFAAAVAKRMDRFGGTTRSRSRRAHCSSRCSSC